MTTRARPRRPRETFLWTREWPLEAGASAFAGLTGRTLPGFDAEPGSPYASGNLGLNVGDDAELVRSRRAAIAERIGVSRLVLPSQVHGTDVVVVDEDTPDQVTADALVSVTSGIALGVTVADCVPVMLIDVAAGVIAVAHAGRRGMAEGVVPATLQAMADLGAEVVSAVVGPSICARCYEVPEDLRAAVAVHSPVSASVSRTGTPAIDVVAGVLDQLATRTVEIELLPGCTAESGEFFSHRGSGGSAGRFAGLVWRTPTRSATRTLAVGPGQRPRAAAGGGDPR